MVRSLPQDVPLLAKIKATSKQVELINYFNAEKCLGRTFDSIVMCDIGSVTPNIYCQIAETLRKGGVICIIAPSTLHNMRVQAHNKYKTALWTQPKPVLLARIYKLVTKATAVVVSDAALHVINKPRSQPAMCATKSVEKSLEPQSSDLSMCVTEDQRHCLSSLIDAIFNKIANFVAVTAARGRGKSAMLGIFAAIGLSRRRSVILTAPTQHNCATLMQFCRAMLDTLGIKYRSTDISIHTTSDMSLRFEKPFRVAEASLAIGSTCIVIVDEAAAIGAHLFKDIVTKTRKLKVPMVVASTVAGYEGTGRSFSLKTLSQMSTVPILRMEEPIRYRANDPLEQLTYKMFLLDGEESDQISLKQLPDDLEIVSVNKKRLFSGEEETQLGEIVALFVDSHYMNSPNDLMLLADCPGHGLIVAKSGKRICCVLQYSTDGGFASKEIKDGENVNGDLISWKLLEWHDSSWNTERMGLRIVRIATALWCRRLGIGKLVVDRLYSAMMKPGPTIGKSNDLFRPIDSFVADLTIPSGVEPTWLGTAFGLTPELFKFWSSCNFHLIHMATNRNEVTGEVSCILMRGEELRDVKIDFFSRFMRTLHLDPEAKLSSSFAAQIISQYARNFKFPWPNNVSSIDINRLQRYADGLSDRAICRSMLPEAVRKALVESFSSFSALGATVLIGLILQNKPPDALAEELGVASGEVILSQHRKACLKLAEVLKHNKIDNVADHNTTSTHNRQKRQSLFDQYKKVSRKSQ